jgi:cell shape-determining protein MreC
MEITKTNEEKIQQLEEENKKIKESFKKLKSKYDGAAELLKIFEINEKSKKNF